MNEHQRQVLFGTGNDEYGTPDSIYDPLNKEFGFTLDPCAAPEGVYDEKKEQTFFTKPKCEKFFTMEDNGLEQDWSGEVVFVNPPYSKVMAWTKKILQEIDKTFVFTRIVFLVPARTETKWFKLCWENAANMYFYHKRIQFLQNGIAKGSAGFPSVLIEFDSRVKREGDRFIFNDYNMIKSHHRYIGLVDHDFKRLS